MRKHLIPMGMLALSASFIGSGCAGNNSEEEHMPETTIAKAPVAQKKEHMLNAHGTTRNDEYYWMRLSEAQRNAETPDAQTQEVIDHLNAENKYTEEVLAPIKGFREDLFQELKGRIKEDDSSVPVRDNGYWYHHEYSTGQEYAVHYRKKDGTDAVNVLLNENKQADGLEYFDLGTIEISTNNNLMAYSVDEVGRRQFELRFRDLTTGMDLPDRIENCSGGCAWANDNKTVFYTRKDHTLRSFKIFKHELGTDPKKDKVVFHEEDPTFSCYVYRSRSGKFIMAGSGSTLSAEYWTLSADDPQGEFSVFLPREEKHEYSVAHRPGEFFILTNWKAKNFRLMKCPEGKTSKEHWTEVVAHRDTVLLEDVDVFKEHLVLGERHGGLSHLRVMNTATGKEHEISFNDPAYVTYTVSNPELNTTTVRYGYQSLTTPNSVYEHDMITGKDKLLKQKEVLGGFKSGDYASERIWVPARDNTEIPVSIVYKKGLKKDGTAPLLLYGYGSYGNSIDPTFNSNRLSLLDRGFVYAIAHIRGGEELGRQWYENGKLKKKENTFTDFIDCGKFLVKDGYAAPDQLHALGGSAGGLLMGAVINMEPDMWNSVVAAVPFVDVVTTMLDDSIPLTTGEFDEWGDPKDLEFFDVMMKYSPYDNVKDQDYPALLVTTGFHDSQVQYWEPAKWVARLREHQKANDPILIHTNMDAGHGGASGRFESLKEVALMYGFVLEHAGRAK